MYGSFYERLDGSVGETEYEALKEVKRRIRKADPALLERLEFDHEADGTGVWSEDHEDLTRMLEIIRPTPEMRTVMRPGGRSVAAGRLEDPIAVRPCVAWCPPPSRRR